MTEPDAWQFTETIETVAGGEKESEQASLYHPESDKFQFYLTDSHEIEIEEPLYSASTIQEEFNNWWSWLQEALPEPLVKEAEEKAPEVFKQTKGDKCE